MHWFLRALIACLMSRASLVAEIACLRQQLAVYQRRQPRPWLHDGDRRFWILISRFFSRWQESVVVVTPQTVLRWHRRGWRAYWRWKSKIPRPGRKRIPLALRQLIRRIAAENPLWGQVRIMAELLKLGVIVSPRTVRKYMRRPWSGSPSPHWREFLTQQAKDIWACDFLTERTLTFQTLYVFFLIHHATREIVHLRVTRHPTAAWTGLQLVNACFDRASPLYLIRDRDSIYGIEFSRKARGIGIQEIRTPVHAPTANSIAERFVGTLRRECLDHVFVFNERHLQKVVEEFAVYYNRHRPHRTLNHCPPCPADTTAMNSTGPPIGIIAEPVLGGLHHVYRKAA